MTDNITHGRVTQLLLDVMEFTYNSDSLSEAEKKVLDHIRAALAEPEPDAIAAKYNELLMAVWQKHPGETRHETALRYITQAEQRTTTADQAEEVKP